MEIVPGLTLHEHEGHMSGTFELSNSDLAAIRWDGRVMLAVVVDIVAPFRVTTTKDGTNLAHWTFKAVDVAFIRDESVRQSIAKVVGLEGIGSIDPHPLDAQNQPPRLALEGVYDEEGAYLGMTPENSAFEGSWSPTPEDLASLSRTVTTVGEASGDGELRRNVKILDEDGAPEDAGVVVASGSNPRDRMFQVVGDGNDRNEGRDGGDFGAPQAEEVIGGPIRHGDATLDRFLSE